MMFSYDAILVTCAAFVLLLPVAWKLCDWWEVREWRRRNWVRGFEVQTQNARQVTRAER